MGSLLGVENKGVQVEDVQVKIVTSRLQLKFCSRLVAPRSVPVNRGAEGANQLEPLFPLSTGGGVSEAGFVRTVRRSMERAAAMPSPAAAGSCRFKTR